MITEENLIDLGYSLKTKLINGTKDYKISDRNYFVNLSKEGIITVVYGNNNKTTIKPLINCLDLDEFISWHNNYKE